MVIPRTARRELLTRLLEKHEASSAYGKPAPWPRDVILRIDAETFPAAFGPEGREILEAIKAAARELDRAGAARLTFHRAAEHAEPRELRLGPAELPRAYALAEAEGFAPLSLALSFLEARARELDSEALPAWLRTFLGRVVDGARSADLSPLGRQRATFKRDVAEICDALRAVAAVAPGVNAWERVLSEQLFRDSKRLGGLRAMVSDLLLRADPRWDGSEGPEPAAVLETYGVRRRPGQIRCAGRATFRIGERTYALEDFVPTASVPEAWSGALVAGLAGSGLCTVTTIENEYPFFAYVEESGGPAALGGRGEWVVYTAGFASPALLRVLVGVARACPEAAFRHWGDADAGGFRIWRQLREGIDREVALFRTTAEWLEAHLPTAGRPLSRSDRAALDRLQDQLSAESAARDAESVQDAIATLLRHGLKLEQEHF